MLSRATFRGDNLRIARDFSGLTLEDVGKRVNVKRQYVQQIEVGKRQPSTELVAALSAALGFRPGFFSKVLKHKVDMAACHFRRLKSLPKYRFDWFSAYSTLFLYVLEFLDERLGLPQFQVPEILVSTNSEIESAAQECRKVLEIPSNAPIKSVVRMVEAAGVPVASFSGISDQLDAFSMVKGRPLIVRSLDKECGSRSRFDLAHELGHLVMHRGLEPGQDHVEKEAHRFAGALLIPKEAFIREFPNSGWHDWSKIFQMKARWGVSVAAIMTRAHDLGLIDAARYRWAYVDLSCRGWRTQEPEETPVESTELLPRAFDYLRSNQSVSPQQAAIYLDFEPVTLERICGLSVPKFSLTS
jgi:Zn-dependent peptidase ImmA (M78 family)/DNA-binding XRE family transcriptional regulator